MATLPVEVEHWLATHHGVIGLRDLVSFSVERHTLDALLRHGHLVRVHHGVYRSAQWPALPLGRCLAACKAIEGGAVSHLWAAHIWGFRRCPIDVAGAPVDVVVPATRQPRPKGIVVRRTTHLTREDLVRRPDGIRLTSPVRTACDLASVLADDALASVVEQVLDQYRVRLTTVLRTADRLIAPGRPGGARLYRVLHGRPDGARAAGSDLELRVANALRAAGLPHPVRQHPVVLECGVTVHPDLAYPDIGVVIEVDHAAWHSGAQAALDKRRDRLVTLAGYQVSRVTDDDLACRESETIDQLVRIVHRRARGR